LPAVTVSPCSLVPSLGTLSVLKKQDKFYAYWDLGQVRNSAREMSPRLNGVRRVPGKKEIVEPNGVDVMRVDHLSVDGTERRIPECECCYGL
jgi:hypothetical protein